MSRTRPTKQAHHSARGARKLGPRGHAQARPRPAKSERDIWEPDEPGREFAPEEKIALQVFYQALIDLSSRTAGPRHTDSAAHFLLAAEPYQAIHAFWCGVLGIEPRAAVEQVMLKHGTQIARVRSWAVRMRRGSRM